MVETQIKKQNKRKRITKHNTVTVTVDKTTIVVVDVVIAVVVVGHKL